MKHQKTVGFIKRSVLSNVKTEQELKALVPGKKRIGRYYAKIDCYSLVVPT